jgi:hypothetical protein
MLNVDSLSSLLGVKGSKTGRFMADRASLISEMYDEMLKQRTKSNTVATSRDEYNPKDRLHYQFFKTVASDWLVGMLNGFPAKASSTLPRAFLMDCRLKQRSTRVSPALNACKLSVFVFKNSF